MSAIYMCKSWSRGQCCVRTNPRFKNLEGRSPEISGAVASTLDGSSTLEYGEA